MSQHIYPWLVVRQRETEPPEVYPFGDEVDARLFYDQAAQQWTDTYLCAVHEGPLACGPSLPLEMARLVEEIGYLRRERARLQDQLSLACEQPPYGCTCPGCTEMRRRAKEAP